MLWELFLVFFKLGAFTIGGGIAMIPLLQESMVDDKKWFTLDEFVEMIAICQSLPGVVAVNMATFVGYRRKGLIGSAVATIAVVLPSFLIILLIAKGMASTADNPRILGAMAGLRAAALGLIIVSIVQLAPTALKSKLNIAGAIASFVLIAVLNINTAYVILIFLALGAFTAVYKAKKNATSFDGKNIAKDIAYTNTKNTCDSDEVINESTFSNDTDDIVDIDVRDRLTNSDYIDSDDFTPDLQGKKNQKDCNTGGVKK